MEDILGNHGLERHPHQPSMAKNGFCLICQHVHSFFVEKKSDHFGPNLGVKDVSEMPAARPGQGAKL